MFTDQVSPLLLQAVEHMERLKSQNVDAPPEVYGRCLLVVLNTVLFWMMLNILKTVFVPVEGNHVPELHPEDNQLPMDNEIQQQEHQPVHHDSPVEHHQQLSENEAQYGLPQTHQDLPPGHQELSPDQHIVP